MACLAIINCQTHALRSHNVPCRPLPAELLQYAQADVHYLRFLTGQLCAMLEVKGAGRLQEAKKRSLEMCLALYSKPASEVGTTHANVFCTATSGACAMQHTDAQWQWQCDITSLRTELTGCKAHDVVHVHMPRLHTLLTHKASTSWTAV